MVMAVLIYSVVGFFILFCIIAGAVKMAVREALSDFKDDLIKELKEMNKDR